MPIFISYGTKLEEGDRGKCKQTKKCVGDFRWIHWNRLPFIFIRYFIAQEPGLGVKNANKHESIKKGKQNWSRTAKPPAARPPPPTFIVRSPGVRTCAPNRDFAKPADETRRRTTLVRGIPRTFVHNNIQKLKKIRLRRRSSKTIPAPWWTFSLTTIIVVNAMLYDPLSLASPRIWKNHVAFPSLKRS